MTITEWPLHYITLHTTYYIQNALLHVGVVPHEVVAHVAAHRVLLILCEEADHFARGQERVP